MLFEMIWILKYEQNLFLIKNEKQQFDNIIQILPNQIRSIYFDIDYKMH